MKGCWNECLTDMIIIYTIQLLGWMGHACGFYSGQRTEGVKKKSGEKVWDVEWKTSELGCKIVSNSVM